MSDIQDDLPLTEAEEDLAMEIMWFISRHASINMMKDLYGYSPNSVRELRELAGLPRSLGNPKKPSENVRMAMVEAWEKLNNHYQNEKPYFYWYGMAQAWPSYSLAVLYSVIKENGFLEGAK
ncbi:MAG: DUF2857 family protein [Thiotrichales bacterium]|jgi:hypothetical protein|nr:DUF2857 family protein [Thiotrichales bacterium]